MREKNDDNTYNTERENNWKKVKIMYSREKSDQNETMSYFMPSCNFCLNKLQVL